MHEPAVDQTKKRWAVEKLKHLNTDVDGNRNSEVKDGFAAMCCELGMCWELCTAAGANGGVVGGVVWAGVCVLHICGLKMGEGSPKNLTQWWFFMLLNGELKMQWRLLISAVPEWGTYNDLKYANDSSSVLKVLIGVIGRVILTEFSAFSLIETPNSSKKHHLQVSQ